MRPTFEKGDSNRCRNAYEKILHQELDRSLLEPHKKNKHISVRFSALGRNQGRVGGSKDRSAGPRGWNGAMACRRARTHQGGALSLTRGLLAAGSLRRAPFPAGLTPELSGLGSPLPFPLGSPLPAPLPALAGRPLPHAGRQPQDRAPLV
jgi:hypothetical protein